MRFGRSSSPALTHPRTRRYTALFLNLYLPSTAFIFGIQNTFQTGSWRSSFPSSFQKTKVQAHVSVKTVNQVLLQRLLSSYKPHHDFSMVLASPLLI
jgi:hypothetical protein